MSPTARWAQLTYATFDSAATASGGWQVKQETPGLSTTEREQLLACVTTSLEPPRGVGRFLGPDEVAALPRRLMHSRSDEGVSVLMHSVPAGADSFGRPGNVFSHGLIDRDLTASLSGPVATRPLIWWRSPGWLTPFGPDEVRAAVFDNEHPPQPAAAVSAEDALALLLSPDPVVRRNTRLLLDATAAALAGGPPVAVITDSVDEGVCWLATALFLASPQSNGWITFSTYERARHVLANGSRTTLTVLLRSDLERSMTKRSAVLVVDPQQDVRLVEGRGEEPSRWRTTREQEVPVSAWSQLVDAVCELGADETRRTLGAVDEISALNPKPAAACPWWPLAVAVGENEALESAWSLATQVLLTTPTDAELDDDTRALFEDLVERASGETRAQAHALLATLAASTPDSSMLAISYRRYLERTLEEVEALAGAPALPISALPLQTQQRVLGELEPFLVERIETIGATPMTGPDWTVRVVRLLSLLESSGLPVTSLGEAPRRALERLGAALLSIYGAPAVRELADTPPGVRRLLGDFVGDVLVKHRNPPGRRLHSLVAEWLAEGYQLAEICVDPNGVLPQTPLLQDLAVSRARLIPDEVPGLRLAAAIALLGSHQWEPGAHPAQRVADGLGSLGRLGGLWKPSEVYWMLRHLPYRPDLDFGPTIRDSLYEYAPDHSSSQMAALALQDPDVASRLTANMKILLTLTQRLRPTWYLDRQYGEVEAIVREGIRCWPYLATYPFGRRLATHLLIAMLLANAERGADGNVGVDSLGFVLTRTEFDRDLVDDIVGTAVVGELDQLHAALRHQNWWLGEFLFVETAYRTIRRTRSALRREIFDLELLFNPYGKAKEAEPEPGWSIQDDADDFFAGSVDPAPPQPPTPVVGLLLPYLLEHHTELSDLLSKQEEFSAAETRKAMGWVMQTLTTMSGNGGRRRARAKG